MSDLRVVDDAFVANLDRLERESLRTGGPSDTSGGVTDDWKTSVERRLSQLHDDVRSLLNRGTIAVCALATMIAGLYLYSNEKAERLANRLTAIEVQQARANEKLDVLLERTKPR